MAIDYNSSVQAYEIMLRIKSYAMGLKDAGKSGYLLDLVDDYNKTRGRYDCSLGDAIRDFENKEQK